MPRPVMALDSYSIRRIGSRLLAALGLVLPACALVGCASTRNHFDDSTAGLYPAQPYARDRIPVLFIHGINGSPRDFRYLLDVLDQTRFQPWLFSYSSSQSLSDVTAQLRDALGRLEDRHGAHAVMIVAHSIGGLIARELVSSCSQARRPEVPLLITLSTPWDGHPGAALAPPWPLVPVHSWRDIAPGSAYLSGLFAAISGEECTLSPTQHHLLFSYHKARGSFGASSDQVVSLASQLRGLAQEQAARVYGFDATHVGILRDPDAAALVTRLLESAPGDVRMSSVR